MHRPEHWVFEGTGLGYGDVLGAAATTVGYECDGCDFTYRDGLPYPTGVDGTPAGFEILGTAPAAHFTRTTATRPPAPNEPSEVEFIAARLFADRSDENVERISHGHAVLGTYTSPAGGVVVTSGSTDWAHGLAGRDPQIEQITENILNRLGHPPRSHRAFDVVHQVSSSEPCPSGRARKPAMSDQSSRTIATRGVIYRLGF